MAEFDTKLGGLDDTGEEHATLVDAAKAAFEIAVISKCWMINVFNPTGGMDIGDLTDSDYVGTAGAQTGIYAVQRMFPNAGAIPNVVCCPGRTDATIVAAIKAVVEKCNGHWDGIGVYDVTQAANQVDSNGIAVISNITKAPPTRKFGLAAEAGRGGTQRLGSGTASPKTHRKLTFDFIKFGLAAEAGRGLFCHITSNSDFINANLWI